MSATRKRCVRNGCHRMAVSDSNYCTDHLLTTTSGKKTAIKKKSAKKKVVRKKTARKKR